jgi:hypothetical protein
MTTTGVELDPQMRGDTFEYSTTLLDGWTVEQFTGGLRFTIRKRYPESSVPDDTDPNVVASVTTTPAAAGGIVAAGTAVTVTIPASATKSWPVDKRLPWDLQGIITGSPNRVETLASGHIHIQPDVGRTT